MTYSKALGISTFQVSLEGPASKTAILLFEKDEKINEVFNQKFIRTIAAIRRVENQAYLNVISSWEREFLLLNV